MVLDRHPARQSNRCSRVIDRLPDHIPLLYTSSGLCSAGGGDLTRQGLADDDIRREILRKKEVDEWPPNKIVAEVESRAKASERARVSTSLAAPQVKAAAVSGYKRPPLVWFFYCSEDLLLGQMLYYCG